MAPSVPAGQSCPRSSRDRDISTIIRFISQAVVDQIELALSHFPDPRKAHIVFSAHGLPVSLIEKGDPYQKQVEETVRLVMEDGALAQRAHALLPEQGWPPEMADARARPRDCGSGLTRRKTSSRRPGLLRHRAHRNAARNQYRGPRTGHKPRRPAI